MAMLDDHNPHKGATHPTRSCLRCDFYEADQNECRRHPPRAQLVPGRGIEGPRLQPASFFPQVPDTLWCGEFKERAP
jgi:hypothetical protein